MKVATILGARPQFIKAAAVSRAIIDYGKFEEIIIHTGQHYDSNMSTIFFDEMSIPLPKYQLSIQEKTHGAMTGRMMVEIESCILQERPDAILVYGDTNSTLAGALVGSKLSLPVFHVEAGLRSFNMQMPEEINRILTDRVSSLLFCPTSAAVKNLENEGFSSFDNIVMLSGDVMEDAVNFYSEKNPSTILAELNLDKYCLATVHRAENTDNAYRLREIFAGLNKVAELTNIVIPIHPRTSGYLSDFDLNERIKIIEPVGYFDMLKLTEGCSLVLTDSGGLQKEAYFASKFCITLRDETEWIELVEHGYNVCVGADRNRIYKEYNRLISIDFNKQHQFYGQGKAAAVIVDKIVEYLR